MDNSFATDLDAHSWVALAIFLFALVFVIRPVRVHITKSITLHFNLATAPPLGLVVLLASQTIHWKTIADGFLGTNVGVQPYAIMLLFYSLASLLALYAGEIWIHWLILDTRLTFAFHLTLLDSFNTVRFGCHVKQAIVDIWHSLSSLS